MGKGVASVLLLAALTVGCQSETDDPSPAETSPSADGQAVVDAEASPVDTGSHVAPALLLTLNELPRAFNGALPYTWDEAESVPFRLRGNGARMTLDLQLEPASGPVDWSETTLQCGETSYGEERLERLADDHARVRFSPDAPHPTGEDVLCSATVRGPGGASSDTVRFDVVEMPASLDPFVSSDVWLVTLERDIFDLQVTALEDGTYAVESAYLAGGDGQSDLDEALEAIGLMSTAHPEAAQAARRALLDEVRAETRAAFELDASGQLNEESVPITIFFEGDAGAPLLTNYDGESFSMIAIGGDGTPAEQETGLVGRALLDPNNQDQENNTTYGLGVYPSAIVRQVLGEPIGALALQPILPGVGIPMGDHPQDALAMDPTYSPTPTDDPELVERHTLYSLVIELFGRAIAATLAHEIGHSLGLVPPGPPPTGLFAEMPGLDLTVHDIPDWHIDTPGLNIMQTGAVTNWLEAAGQEMRFNALNLAYLRRRLVVGPLPP